MDILIFDICTKRILMGVNLPIPIQLVYTQPCTIL